MSGRTPLPLLILLCLSSVSLADEPKLDQFGDPLPEGAIARLGSMRLRNEVPILTAAFTADGKALATCDAASISFWDLNTGKRGRRMPLPIAGSVQLRRFSNDGKILVLGDFKNVLHFLDVASGAEQGTLNHAQCGPIRNWPYLSRDGKILAAVHRTSIAVWDVAGGKLLHEFKEPALAQSVSPGLIALMPDGKQLVLPHADGSLHLVDVASGKEVRDFEMPPPRQGVPPAFRFPRLVLSPDGRYLAFGSPGMPWIVCEVATGKRLHQVGQSQGFHSDLAFTPNSRFVAVDGFNEVRLVGVLSGKEIRKIPKPSGPGTLLVFSPDGRTLAAIPSGHTIYLWDVVAQRRLHPLVGHEGGVQALAFLPDGKRLASADQRNEMRIWDIDQGQTLAQRTIIHAPMSLKVDRDGETMHFASSDSSVHHWNFRTGREEVRPRVVEGLSTTSLVLSPDGRSLAILVPQGVAQQQQQQQQQQRPNSMELRLYDLKTNRSIVVPAPPGQSWVRYLMFTPDSRRLAASCPDGALRLWDRDTGKLVREFKKGAPLGHPAHLVFAPDGRSLALMDGLVRIREIASGKDRLQLPPMSGTVSSLAYSPDARFIASVQGNGQIAVFSAVSGKQLAQWESKQGYVRALAFSRDGRLLASGGENGTILIWKVPKNDSVPAVGEAKEVDSLWQALGDSDAAAANRALAGLAAAPVSALPLFRERLIAIVKELEGAQYTGLIAKLDDDSFKVREKAMQELALAGADAADSLREALQKSPSAEAKRRIEELLARLKTGGSSQRLRFLRAVEALERIGTPKAKEVLRELAGQSLPPELREEVQASLNRLGEKP